MPGHLQVHICPCTCLYTCKYIHVYTHVYACVYADIYTHAAEAESNLASEIKDSASRQLREEAQGPEAAASKAAGTPSSPGNSDGSRISELTDEIAALRATFERETATLKAVHRQDMKDMDQLRERVAQLEAHAQASTA